MNNNKNNGANKTIEKFVDLFTGREDSCAIKITLDGKKMYVPFRDSGGKDIALTTDIAKRHLNGEISLGSYPLDRKNNVRWASVDFDGKKGDALNEAVEVLQALQKKGLIPWLERSQSGNGVHLWIFFDGEVPAESIRGVLSSVIPEFSTPPEARKTSYDRVFPNQNSARGGYGNLCALPLNGKELVSKGLTAFIDEKGNPFENQSQTIDNIYELRNKPEIVQRESAKIPKASYSRKALPVMNAVPGGTKLMAPQGCAWLRDAYKRADHLSEPEWYAALCQFAKVEQGDVLAHRFSQPYKGYSETETQKKIDHAKEENKPMSCQTIWERFGDCGKRCGHLGVNHPWELAKIPLYKLDEGNKGKIYSASEVGQAGLSLIKTIADGERMGFSWGYDLLDDHTELRPRNFVVVAARQGMGKTAVMIDASVNGASRGIPQYVFSMEMGYEELALRYIARISGVSQTQLVTGRCGKEEMVQVEAAVQTFDGFPVFVDDSTSDLDRMLDNAGELIYKHGKGVIWVDYLQLVRKRQGESKKEAVDRMVAGYKLMSKILDSPVVALAQLNRSEEWAGDDDDDLDSWLKDSGDIEQTADVIHYLRGKKGPGSIERRWRLHKERHRASGINFRFVLHQGIFKFESMGYFHKQAVSEGEYSGDEPQEEVFGGI